MGFVLSICTYPSVCLTCSVSPSQHCQDSKLQRDAVRISLHFIAQDPLVPARLVGSVVSLCPQYLLGADLSVSCPDMQVVKGDLTQQQVAAIVNPTSGHLSLTSKVSGAIQKAAGRKLKTACKKLLANLPDGGLAIGSAATMPIRGNPFQNIIHAVTPSAMGELDYGPAG